VLAIFPAIYFTFRPRFRSDPGSKRLVAVAEKT